jgi:hypothetical protein
MLYISNNFLYVVEILYAIISDGKNISKIKELIKIILIYIVEKA